MGRPKHTLGPWIMLNGGQSQFMVATEKNGARVVVADIVRVPGEERANARLISSCPEMLDALRAASQYLAEYQSILRFGSREASEYQHLVETISKVLAKTEGVSNE